MNNHILFSTLCFYGLFLICCGIVAVIFIGFKAKTALISGGLSGTMSLVLAFLIRNEITGAWIAGLLVNLALIVVFAWRATATLFRIFEMIPESHPELKGKGIAFLIISAMCIVSVFVLALQIIFCPALIN